jgi:hypothetical protein
MNRRRNPLAARLARLEAAHDAELWHFTLTDGSTASLPVGVVLDATGDALDRLDRLDTPGAEHPPASRALRLLARVADDTETSMLGRLAVQLAREVVEQEAARGNATRAVADSAPDEEAAE